MTCRCILTYTHPDDATMDNYTRKQIAETLRIAADAIEAGAPDDHPGLEWMSITSHGKECHATPDDAERAADLAAQDAQEEPWIDPDIENTSWGVYVAVEVARIEHPDGVYLANPWED
jgi:hypothetical protein